VRRRLYDPIPSPAVDAAVMSVFTVIVAVNAKLLEKGKLTS